MPIPARTFRVFVSSTFTDLKAERDALQERVFPRLRQLCKRHGFGFQAIDLRWGIRDETALDQQAMNICLHELRRCQEISPRPNYILLVGNRYGWQPVPPQIEALEFEALLEQLGDAPRAQLLRWYRRDDNALPAQYVLLRREGEFAESSAWQEEEQKLRASLRRAADRCFAKGDPRHAKYLQSATHQEVEAGIWKAEQAESHVFAYLREIKGLPRNARASAYLDLNADGSADRDAWRQCEALKAKLRKLLPPGQVRVFRQRATPCWRRWVKPGAPVYEPSPEYLEALCQSVEKDLSRILEAEMAQLASLSESDQEDLDHLRFAEERARHFVGRTGELRRIEHYLAGGEASPLVVHGVSGSGKTALLAKSFLEAKSKALREALVLARWIGATPASSDLRSLLSALGRQLSLAGGEEAGPIPDEIRELVDWFQQRLSSAGRARPVILFLDALDQLSLADDPHSLFWLPRALPDNIRLVVSVLDRTGEVSGQAGEAARRIVPDAMRLEIPLLDATGGASLLSAWLTDARRTLQPFQQRLILESFAASGLPLWLRLTFDQARSWRSFDEPGELAAEIPGLIHSRLDQLSRPENHGPMLVEKALGYLAAARRGLSEDELLEVLAFDEAFWSDFLRQAHHDLSRGQRSVPVIFWARLFADLDLFLAGRRFENTLLLGFYHRQLGECITERFLSPAQKPGFHQTLARYFEAQETWLESREEQRERARRLPPSPRPANLRKADEWAWQQIALARSLEEEGREEELDAARHRLGVTLGTLEFLESKVEGGLAFDLANDLWEAAATLPASDPHHRVLTLLGEALGRDVHFLSRHPTALFQCLWNSAWWYDCPDAAPHYQSTPGWLGASGPDAAGAPKLHRLLERWRKEKEALHPDFLWVRSLRPPNLRLGQGFVSKLEGRPSPITDALFAPDERRMIGGGADGSIRIWDLRDGRQLQSWAGDEAGVRCLALSTDGALLIAGSSNGGVAMWDLREGIRRWQVGGDPSSSVNAVAFSPDDRWFATGSDDGAVTIRSALDGAPVHSIWGHGAPVNCLCISPDGDWVVSGSGKQAEVIGTALPDCSIRIWDRRDGAERICLRGHRQSVTALAVSSDGRHLVSGSTDETIRIWDFETGTEEKVLGPYEGVIGQVTSLALLDHGRRIASAHSCHSSYGYYTAPIRLFDLDEGREIRQFPEESDVSRLVVSPSGRFLGAVTSGAVRVFRLEGAAGEEQARLRSPTIGFELILAPDGNLLMWRNGVVGVGWFGCSGWDLRTWEDRDAVAQETYDAAVKAAQDSALTEWRLIVQESDTCFLNAAANEVAAWHPQALEGAAADREGRKWVSKQGDYVHLIALEGDSPAER